MAPWGLECRKEGSRPIFLSLLGSHNEVTLPQIREALISIDPSLEKQTLNSYLIQAFQLPMTELPEEGEEKEESIVVQLKIALQRLQMIDIRRMGSREPEPAS